VKIYTKTGDEGETSLFGGKRVAKSSLRIEAYGTVDELNSHLGLARALVLPKEIDEELLRLQTELFTLGADLATPLSETTSHIARIDETNVARLERVIDRLDEQMPPLKNFILPSGTPIAAQLHIARTVCRRAERAVDALGREEPLGALPLMYLNRLADLLFVLARYVNHCAGVSETPWIGKDR
jgi:cob(I)alamin adenosyltransferase